MTVYIAVEHKLCKLTSWVTNGIINATCNLNDVIPHHMVHEIIFCCLRATIAQRTTRDPINYAHSPSKAHGSSG